MSLVVFGSGWTQECLQRTGKSDGADDSIFSGNSYIYFGDQSCASYQIWKTAGKLERLTKRQKYHNYLVTGSVCVCRCTRRRCTAIAAVESWLHVDFFQIVFECELQLKSRTHWFGLAVGGADITTVYTYSMHGYCVRREKGSWFFNKLILTCKFCYMKQHLTFAGNKKAFAHSVTINVVASCFSIQLVMIRVNN